MTLDNTMAATLAAYDAYLYFRGKGAGWLFKLHMHNSNASKMIKHF